MPRLRAVTAMLLCALSGTASAFVPKAPPKLAASELTALAGAHLPAGKALRGVRKIRHAHGRPTPAWARFASAAGGRWEATWDAATGVPTRIWGSGIAAPGANASPEIAAQVARGWLADHLDLLAPGAAAGDFVLVTNTVDGDLRVLGFAQRAGGRDVVGGQISFEYKRDRLFVIGSTALPDVRVPAPSRARRPPAATVLAQATTTLRDELGLPAAQPSALGAEVVVPLVGDDGVIGYRVGAPMTMTAGSAGIYLAYVDLATGEPFATRQQASFANGTVIYNTVDRYPGRGRLDAPAALAHVAIAGATETSGHDGAVSWASSSNETVTTAVVGDLVAIVNMGMSGSLATVMLPIAPGGTARWDASAVAEDDAQVVTYVSVNQVKDFVRAHLDPLMPTLDDSINANVNIDDDCNAFYDGKAVNFFRSSMRCENTGRMADVVYHEFGHAVHNHEVIPDVGAIDGAMGEGAADFLAVNITQDSGLGRGFFFNDKPLRELDPEGREATWPRDIGEIHTTGMIFGGTFWDIRKAAHAALGDDDGEVLTLALYLGALRRSIDIPSSLVEVLATDDDDGDLSNGTPHECMIRDAYGEHGLRDVTGVIAGPGVVNFHARAIQVTVSLGGLVDRCHADDVEHVTLEWTDAPDGTFLAGSADATRGADGTYYATLPLPLNGELDYYADVVFRDHTTLRLPDNFADPDYHLYQGDTIKLYCTDFETRDPLQDGWTTATKDGTPSPWAWAVPAGGTATEPPAAYSGTHALEQGPGVDYTHDTSSSVAMPVIDVGRYSDVRLQYRRWLAVEDSTFDQARITANGAQVWVNTTTGTGTSSAYPHNAHIDREWMFQDVALSGAFHGHQLTVGWDLTSDPGLEFAGWAIDDVCVVANPASICGDGTLAATEECDDGAANADYADTCRTDCSMPRCGDGITDTGEDCDAGGSGDADCSTSCKTIAVGGGGCSSSGGGAGWLVMGLVGLTLRRRSSTLPWPR